MIPDDSNDKKPDGPTQGATFYEQFCRLSSGLYDRPVYLCLLVMASIFCAETLVMLLLRRFPALPMLPEAFLDALLLSLLALPILYILFLKPLAYNIRNREKAEIERKKALEFDRMKSVFISTAAHELYTPLASIEGYVELLTSPEHGFTEAERQGFLAVIQKKTEVLERIVDDLLQLSRSESGHALSINPEPGDIATLIADAAASCRRLFPHHRIETDLPPGLPALLVDRVRIGQVLGNLLGNAAKYSPAGSVIRVSAEGEGDRVRLQVRDEGVGMTAEQSAHAFDKFYRADPSDTGRGGLGLGLSIARMIVEAHAGTIRLMSTPGLGTTVSFTLPLPAEERRTTGDAPAHSAKR